MTQIDLTNKAFVLYQTGVISYETYAEIAENADALCESEDCDSFGLPDSYAEVEYSDFDNAEAIDGAQFDDMNYLRYTER